MTRTLAIAMTAAALSWAACPAAAQTVVTAGGPSDPAAAYAMTVWAAEKGGLSPGDVFA
jgi:hypothetical protein